MTEAQRIEAFANMLAWSEYAVFLGGAGGDGADFLCIDTVDSGIREIALPDVGPIVSLNGSNSGTCVAVTLSARPDEKGTPRELFTLFEVDAGGEVCRQTELTGVRRINLLAIGTPQVNGCALLESGILIIVNNRVILLDRDGALLDFVVWESGSPRIAARSDRSVFVYDTDADAITIKTVSVTRENTLKVNATELPGSITAIIPANAGTVYAVEGKKVFSFDPSTGKKKAAWEFPYGFDPEKDYCWNGEELLVQSRRGQIGLYRIR